ncbi:hypothetical protein [Bacilliculturomica massiliensis]|uniref:hypothetical protein n=1 Tax=Bacilliculturomica massiliensis TaxID=1917867 RepID=UPI0010300FE3|nr:hypothetical protein [Bacilliculturomica massiliensis]
MQGIVLICGNMGRLLDLTGFFLFAGRKGAKTKKEWLRYVYKYKICKLFFFSFNTKVRSKRKKRHKSTRQTIEMLVTSSVFFFFDGEYKAKRKNGFSQVFDQLLICIILYSIDWT